MTLSQPRFLITTADERTWYYDEPVVFLGEWCRIYDRKSAWQGLDAEVVNYHWDDREKLYRDYKYLIDLYERLLKDLADKLNSIHGYDRSVLYWRILLGPWLGTFIQILFDRWSMIEKVMSEFEIVGVKVLGSDFSTFVPNDMEQFSKWMFDDSWNGLIYSEILKCKPGLIAEEVQPNSSYNNSSVVSFMADRKSLREVLSKPKILLRKLAKWAANTLSSFCRSRSDEYFFISTYLPRREEAILQVKLGQLPKFWFQVQAPAVAIDSSKRKWDLSGTEKEPFMQFVRAMIPRHVPLIYLEGYNGLLATCGSLPWPNRPRLIFTSNSFWEDDVFKAWAAEKAEIGTPIVVGQHGGGYGCSRISFSEYHETAISDAWLSWGWGCDNDQKVHPTVNFLAIEAEGNWDSIGYALLVEMEMNRYSYRLDTVPISSQWLKYADDQYRFVSALPSVLQKELLIRLYMHNLGWCQKSRWRDNFPHVQTENGSSSIMTLIKRSRICISSYNSTTFLNTLTLNIPTIIFWNPNYWELRDDAIPYFNRLKEAGIFHETPESAAAKVVEIWDDVPGWWNQPLIQEAREYFCWRFARKVDNPTKVIKSMLNLIIREKDAGNIDRESRQIRSLQ